MLIAIPVENQSLIGDVCQSFGRSPYFLIYNTNTKESNFIDNQAASSQGGAGIKAAQTLIDHNVNAVITPRLGKNAAEVMKEVNMEIFKSINKSIKENIEAFIDGEISHLEYIHDGFHNHGGE